MTDGGPFEDLMLQANQYQKEILMDGEVAYAEYERAVLDAMGCVDERLGNLVETDGPRLDPGSKRIVFDLGWTVTGDDEYDEQVSEDAANTTFVCLAEYVDYVEMAYLRVGGPTEAEMQEDIEALLTCLADAGFSGLDGLSGVDIGQMVTNSSSDMNAAGGQCMTDHQLGLNSLLSS